jgi:hypothetical protein
MRKLFPIILLISIFTCPAQAQRKRDRAKDNIVMLKEGALLVRLRTSDLQIEGLKKMGKTEEAEKLKAEQEARNNSIIAAFKKEFTFCKVYFFYSSHSADVTAGNCKGIIFDADLNLYADFNCEKCLVGEFDKSETTSLDAFIIKNRNYEQLKSPFPYLVRLNQAFVSTRSDEKIVQTLNGRLFEFYSK